MKLETLKFCVSIDVIFLYFMHLQHAHTKDETTDTYTDNYDDSNHEPIAKI